VIAHIPLVRVVNAIGIRVPTIAIPVPVDRTTYAVLVQKVIRITASQIFEPVVSYLGHRSPPTFCTNYVVF
jgi:hypothetical protein